MNQYPEEYKATGFKFKPYHDEIYQFGKYDITVRLTMDGTFVGIIKIEKSKNFMSLKQKRQSIGYFDIGKYFQDEDD